MHPYLEKFKLLFTNPKGFFTSVEKEVNYWEILKFYVIFIISAQVISLIINLPLFLKDNLLITAALTGLLSAIIFAFIGPFIGAGIVHLGVLIFGGRQRYFNTFKPMTYGAVIGAGYSVLSSLINGVYGWFNPVNVENLTMGMVNQVEGNMFIIVVGSIISLVSLIHILYASTNGLSLYQQLTKLKAFLAIILVPVILIIILGALFGAGLFAASAMFGGL